MAAVTNLQTESSRKEGTFVRMYVIMSINFIKRENISIRFTSLFCVRMIYAWKNLNIEIIDVTHIFTHICIHVSSERASMGTITRARGGSLRAARTKARTESENC